MMNDVDSFFLAHFNIVASVFVFVVGYIKLVQSSKSNGEKLDTVLNKTESMQLEVSKQGVQMSNVAKDVGEIKSDIRSHDKEISTLKAELAGVRSQLKAS